MEVAQVEDVLFFSLHGLEGELSLIQAAEGLLDIGKETLAVGRQGDAPFFPKEQFDAQLFFQFVHGIRKTGLGNVQFLGCMGIMEHPGKGFEIQQLQQCHRTFTSLSCCLYSTIGSGKGQRIHRDRLS